MDHNELMKIIGNAGNEVTENVAISLKNDNDEYNVVKIPLLKSRVEELRKVQDDYGIEISEERWDDIDKHTDVTYLIGMLKIKFLIDDKNGAWSILERYHEEILNELPFDDLCGLTGFDVATGYYQTYRYLHDKGYIDEQTLLSMESYSGKMVSSDVWLSYLGLIEDPDASVAFEKAYELFNGVNPFNMNGPVAPTGEIRKLLLTAMKITSDVYYDDYIIGEKIAIDLFDDILEMISSDKIKDKEAAICTYNVVQINNNEEFDDIVDTMFSIKRSDDSIVKFDAKRIEISNEQLLFALIDSFIELYNSEYHFTVEMLLEVIINSPVTAQIPSIVFSKIKNLSEDIIGTDIQPEWTKIFGNPSVDKEAEADGVILNAQVSDYCKVYNHFSPKSLKLIPTYFGSIYITNIGEHYIWNKTCSDQFDTGLVYDINNKWLFMNARSFEDINDDYLVLIREILDNWYNDKEYKNHEMTKYEQTLLQAIGNDLMYEECMLANWNVFNLYDIGNVTLVQE